MFNGRGGFGVDGENSREILSSYFFPNKINNNFFFRGPILFYFFSSIFMYAEGGGAKY